MKQSAEAITPSSQPAPRPYGELRDDPRYGELRHLIEGLPPEKIEKLKNYIKRLTKKRT